MNNETKYEVVGANDAETQATIQRTASEYKGIITVKGTEITLKGYANTIEGDSGTRRFISTRTFDDTPGIMELEKFVLSILESCDYGWTTQQHGNNAFDITGGDGKAVSLRLAA